MRSENPVQWSGSFFVGSQFAIGRAGQVLPWQAGDGALPPGAQSQDRHQIPFGSRMAPQIRSLQGVVQCWFLYLRIFNRLLPIHTLYRSCGTCPLLQVNEVCFKYLLESEHVLVVRLLGNNQHEAFLVGMEMEHILQSWVTGSQHHPLGIKEIVVE